MKNPRCTSLERRVHLAALGCRWHHAVTPPLPPQPLRVNLLLDLSETHGQQLDCSYQVGCSLLYYNWAVTQLLRFHCDCEGLIEIFAVDGAKYHNLWGGKYLQLEGEKMEENQKGMES